MVATGTIWEAVLEPVPRRAVAGVPVDDADIAVRLVQEHNGKVKPRKKKVGIRDFTNPLGFA